MNRFELDDRYGSSPAGYRSLMRDQVRNILFVSSLYESFIMAEDGHLHELVLSKFLDLNLRQAPDLRRVPSGREALALLEASRRYDLVIASPELGDMDVLELARTLRERGITVPVVLLAYDQGELTAFLNGRDTSDLERVFLWQGDARILLAIVKSVEDRINADHDTRAGVPVFLVVEDNVRFYSSFLPVIYSEVMNLSQAVMSEGGTLLQRLLRMRARPKILLATTYEEAWAYFTRYRNDALGLISDIEFPRGGEPDPSAGIRLARTVREIQPDLPIALQSSNPDNQTLAWSLGAGFLQKGSPEILRQLRTYLTEHLFFGDFVFRLPDGTEIDRAGDLRTMVRKLRAVPAESLALHASRNDFSRWLRARAEFGLAARLAPQKFSDFPTVEDVRHELISSIDGYRRERQRSTVAPFDPETFDPHEGIAQIGTGSLGGKGRGLAFSARLLDEVRLDRRWEGIRISVPPAVILGTDVFEAFMDQDGLRSRALQAGDHERTRRQILDAPFPAEARADLEAFARQVTHPLAVRSSSLLEDSPHQPFAGIYDTRILPNDHPDPRDRLEALLRAIKEVYASTFTRKSKTFIGATRYRLEEEQMAVILQKAVGMRRGSWFFPDLGGVARSHNYYPVPPAGTEDGIVAVALGLGQTVAQGEPCLRFSPAHPRHLVDLSTVEDKLENAQRKFWALRLGRDPDEPGSALERLPLETAEKLGALALVGSTYSPENHAVYDGIGRDGVRLVTFAPILKHGAFPLAEILQELLMVARAGTRSPVEIEFAANVDTPPGRPAEFAFLQLRPLAPGREDEAVEIGEIDPDDLICESPSVLGHGRLDELRDLVVVDQSRFDRAKSRECAQVVARFNRYLAQEGTPYVLVGVGRWGSTHPWLGIPVSWEDIAGAKVIVEAGFKDFRVTPSQGTHFFQNLTSLSVGYFTVNQRAGEGFVDWEWLDRQPSAGGECGVRHIRLDEPMVVKMDGRSRRGIIRKPGRPDARD